MLFSGFSGKKILNTLASSSPLIIRADIFPIIILYLKTVLSIALFFHLIITRQLCFLSCFFYLPAVAMSDVVNKSCLHVTPIRLELPSAANQIAFSKGVSHVRRLATDLRTAIFLCSSIKKLFICHVY